MHKYLIILRCGDKSLHRQWFDGGVSPDFDLILSYFGNAENYSDKFATSIHRYKGSKWEGLNDFVSKNSELVSQYRYVWLPDDDILTDVSTINAFFKYVDRENFALAQPALDERSFFSHPVTLQNKSFSFRETNFVEVMVPCFSSEALRMVKDGFEHTKSGWGLDYLWPSQLSGLGRVGIVDRFAVFHTRPIGSAGHGMGASAKASEAVTPVTELHRTLRAFGLKISVKVRRARMSDDKKTLESGLLGNPLLYIYGAKGSLSVRREDFLGHARILKEYIPWIHLAHRHERA